MQPVLVGSVARALQPTPARASNRQAVHCIKEGKNAVTWGRLSCRRFAANAVRLQLHALAYNLANCLRTLAPSAGVEHWSMTTLRDRLIKIGAKIVRHGRSITF